MSLVLRLVRAAAVVLGVVALTFVLLHLAPGDPVTYLVGPSAPEEQVAALTRSLGLDRPLLQQFGRWLLGAARGDFGTSIATGRAAVALLAQAWPATALLVGLSIVLGHALGILIGTIQANTRWRALDTSLSVSTVTLYAMPGYWLGLVLVMVFAYLLRWLPAFGAAGLDADFLDPWSRLVDRLRHLTLPLLTLTVIGAGGVARYARGSMRELRDAGFLAVARAKGLKNRTAVGRHQLRNALIPIVTLLGLSLPALFSGAVFVEAIFAWPGVGQVLVQAVRARDYPVVMAATTISAILVVTANLLTEWALARLDPRISPARPEGVG